MEKQNLKIKQKYFFGFGSTMEKQKYDKEQSLRQSIMSQSCNITYKRNVIGQVLSFFFLIFIIFFFLTLWSLTRCLFAIEPSLRIKIQFLLRVQFIQYSWVNDNSVKKYKRNKINRYILTVPEGDVMNNVAYH